MKILKIQPLKSKKMKTNVITVIIVSLLFFAKFSFSQQKVEMDTMPFQLSFITPVGTNGVHSWNTVNNFSLNLYAGYAGGLDGFEATGFVSVLRSNMRGVQFTGFVNADLGRTKGAQFAGFVNYNKGEMVGFQGAGFVNTITNNLDGIQASGFVNTVVGGFEGAQFAGFVNTATKKSKGAQFAGFVNAVSDSIDGFQGAGFVNYSMGNTMGQVSGFTNVNVGDQKGVQASGFVNINTGRVDGAQLAGFANFARVLKGTQIGVFNYVDSLEKGTPIGFISFVRNGYHAVELSTSETLYGIASFKTGTERFYNIISLGGAVRNNQILWGWGYGVGTMIKASEKLDLTIEAQSFQINQDEWYTHRLNNLNKLGIQASYKLLPGLEVFGGPTFNVVVSDTRNHYGLETVTSIAPYTTFSKVYPNDIKVEMYPGITAGIRF